MGKNCAESPLYYARRQDIVHMDLFEKSSAKKIAKGSILLRKGELGLVTYKVTKGCLRSYVLDKAGKEHILQFAPEGWYIGDTDSFMNLVPSSIFIDAIEDSEVLVLHKDSLEKIEEHNPAILLSELNRLLRNHIATRKRLIALLSASAEERYLDFVDTYPALVQRLPLKLIASYLGITPEYLSEVRKKLSKK